MWVKKWWLATGLFNDISNIICLHSVESCLPRVREAGKNMGENSCKIVG
jgi:hypothetical protein